MRFILVGLVVCLAGCGALDPPAVPNAKALAESVAAGSKQVSIYDFCSSCPHTDTFFSKPGNALISWEENPGAPKLETLPEEAKETAKDGGVVLVVRNENGRVLFAGVREGGFGKLSDGAQYVNTETAERIFSQELGSLRPVSTALRHVRLD